MNLRNFINSHDLALKLWSSAVRFIGKIKWQRTQAVINNGVYYSLQESDLDTIRKLLKEDYLIILTRRRCHFTTYMTQLFSWLAGSSSYYTHALMNVEGDIKNNIDFKLIEATGEGVHYSTFMKVFDCDSVAFLKPKNIALSEWTRVMDSVKASSGREYDTLFDLQTEDKVSCVELIFQGLRLLPEYKTQYAELIELINRHGNDLTPQMLYDSGDLELVLEIRR